VCLVTSALFQFLLIDSWKITYLISLLFFLFTPNHDIIILNFLIISILLPRIFINFKTALVRNTNQARNIHHQYVLPLHQIILWFYIHTVYYLAKLLFNSFDSQLGLPNRYLRSMHKKHIIIIGLYSLPLPIYLTCYLIHDELFILIFWLFVLRIFFFYLYKDNITINVGSNIRWSRFI